MEVDNLRAHISVLAELANLLNLSVGAEVQLGGVKLEIDGVRAKALLKVRLENVRAILEKALETLGEHPEILENLAQALTEVLRETLRDASSALDDVLGGSTWGTRSTRRLRGGWRTSAPTSRGPWSAKEAGRPRGRASWSEEEEEERAEARLSVGQARLPGGPPTRAGRAPKANRKAQGASRPRRPPGARPRSSGLSSRGWKAPAQEGASP